MRNHQWLLKYPSQGTIGYSSEEFNTTVPKLYRTLEDYISGYIPNSLYNAGDLKKLVTSLIENQNGPGEFLRLGGNWSLVSIDEGVPTEARVDYVYFPSYLAVSLLVTYWHKNRREAETIPHFTSRLRQGIFFITARQLSGHGYEGDIDRIEAVKILLRGGVHKYLLEHIHDCKKCLQLYFTLSRFKADSLRQGRLTFELKELLKELTAFPNIPLMKQGPFLVSKSEGKNVLIEAPYTISPGSELHTEDIAVDVAARTSCHAIVGRVSKNQMRYTGNISSITHPTLLKYNKILKKFFPGDPVNRSQLHLIIRGMSISTRRDIELSTRGGDSCDQGVLAFLHERLAILLRGYTRKSYSISCNSLFGGGSKYLDYFKNGIPNIDNSAFGENYNVVEIRLGRQLRDSELGRIKDVLSEVIEDYDRKY